MESIHDRLSTDLPINSVVSIAIVDDPLERGAKLRVLRSIRDDPLAGMHARNQIDEAMLIAGRTWQKLHENAEIGGLSAIDPTKEAVDGGRIPEPITDKQIKAIRELSRANGELGIYGASLMFDVLARRLSIAEVARSRHMLSDREITYIGRRFRECLETLAKLWGLAG